MEHKTEERQPHLKLVTVVLLMSNIMAGLDGTIVNTAMPAITSDLHALSYIGWIVAIFLLGMSVSTPLWSKFGEHVGNKVAFLAATLLFIGGSIFQGSAQNIQFFIISRAIMGIGAGGMNTIPMIAYGFLYDDLHQRAQVVGLSSAFFNTASIVGPLLGGWIVDTWNWRWIFYINVPIALVSITIVGLYFKPTHHGAAGKDIDYRGATLMVLGLTAILAGIEMVGTSAGWLVAVMLIAGVVLMIWMAMTERHVQDPIIPGRLFANKQLVVDFSLFVVMWGGLHCLYYLHSDVGPGTTRNERSHWWGHANSGGLNKLCWRGSGGNCSGTSSQVLVGHRRGLDVDDCLWHCFTGRSEDTILAAVGCWCF